MSEIYVPVIPNGKNKILYVIEVNDNFDYGVGDVYIND